MTGAVTGVALLAIAFDAAVEPLSDFTGSPPLVLFLAVFAVETLLLRLLKWGPWGRSALGSFVMNALSALVGALVDLRMPDALVYGFFLSVPIEASVLLLFDRTRKLRALVSALGANVGSYVLLVAVYVSGRSFF